MNGVKVSRRGSVSHVLNRVTSRLTRTTCEPWRHVGPVCASSRVVQDFFLGSVAASVFNRFLLEVHIHCGSLHLVRAMLSAHNGTGCAHMCCMHIFLKQGVRELQKMCLHGHM